MISFNNIPTTLRVPGAYTEVDNSRAVTGLIQNPHKVLILGQKLSTGSVPIETVTQISRTGIADGYFGTGSILARMCNKFKEANPYTDVYALALSNNGGTTASGHIIFSALNSVTGDCTYYLMINGKPCYTTLTSAWSNPDIISAIRNTWSAAGSLPVNFSLAAGTSNILTFSAKLSGTLGNYIDIRANVFPGQSNPLGYTAITYSVLTGGTVDPTIADAWAIIDTDQYHHIVNPYFDATNMTSLEGELNTRWTPLKGMPGLGYTAYQGTFASCVTFGLTRNNPWVTCMGVNGNLESTEEWAAAVAGVASYYLQDDPGRPLQYLQLPVTAPNSTQRFNLSERNSLLYDGISTFLMDSGGNVNLERIITMYRNNAAGLADPSYLNIETPATLMEIRFQYNARMVSRFIIPRFKLADDTFPVQPGQKIATPKTIKAEIISLFTSLQNDEGLIEDLQTFITNLVVQRNTTNVDRVDVLLPPNLINQFRILSTQIQFVL